MRVWKLLFLVDMLSLYSLISVKFSRSEAERSKDRSVEFKQMTYVDWLLKSKVFQQNDDEKHNCWEVVLQPNSVELHHCPLTM